MTKIIVPKNIVLKLVGVDINGNTIYESEEVSSLIEMAKEKYPVGAKFHPAHLDQKDHYCIITEDSEFKIDSEDSIYSYANKKSCSNKPEYGNCVFERIVLHHGKWAEVVEETEPVVVKACVNCDHFTIIYNVNHPCFDCHKKGGYSNFKQKEKFNSNKTEFKFGSIVKNKITNSFHVVGDVNKPTHLIIKYSSILPLWFVNQNQKKYELSSLEVFQEYLKPYNKKWNPDKLKLEDLFEQDQIYKTSFGIWHLISNKENTTEVLGVFGITNINSAIRLYDNSTWELKTKEELQELLKGYNKTWNFNNDTLEELKYFPQPGDCFTFVYQGYDFYGVCKTTNKSKIQCYIAIGIGRSSVNDWYSLEYDFVKIEPQVINDQLVRFNEKWNFELNILESLDEFAHLPQKIEDLIIRTENKTIKEIEDQIEKAPTISKYTKAIQIQPKLLQLYEAWKDEGSSFQNDYVIYLNEAVGYKVKKDVFSEGSLFKFKSQEKAERFLELFKNELEAYKSLMGGN